MVTYLMMRYATKDINSIKKIQQIISETFSEIILTSDKLTQFWTDNLLPHLHNGASAFTQVQNQVIFQLYLTYGRHFWAKLDLQKCVLFSNFEDLTILYQVLTKTKLGAFDIFKTLDV